MYKLIHGNALKEIEKLKEKGILFDMVLTDPPYSSGGRTMGERRQDPIQKYNRTDVNESRQEQKEITFTGDNLDQRAWTKFTTEWMDLARQVSKPSAIIAAFIDWRQLPAMTDALQMAGWTWRGIAVWNKGNAMPIPNGIRQTAEFIVWGSNGAMEKKADDSTFTMGVMSVSSVPSKSRLHMTEKPLELMRQLVKVAKPNAKILDPFMGSGSTIHAAELEGRHSVGIELTDHYYNTAVERLAEYERAKQNNKPIEQIGE